MWDIVGAKKSNPVLFAELMEARLYVVVIRKDRY